MSYSTLRGFGAFGGTFAPDCYLATGKPDTLGKPADAATIAGFKKTYGPSVDAVAAACNQSADPATCLGQNFLSKPFLGRPCQPEWRSWTQAKVIALASTPIAATNTSAALAPPAEEPDNTLLYAGIAGVALVAVGAAVMLRKK